MGKIAIDTLVLNDATSPVLNITNPVSGQRWSNMVFTVSGYANNNVEVDSVWYQLNTNAWAQAAGTINWSADVTSLLATNMVSTNTIKAFAMDTTGNKSSTNSVNFVSVLSDMLRVRAVGQGTLSPNYSNAMLEIGKSYSITASGINGQVFTNWMISTNWVGGVTSDTATVQFAMQPKLTLQVTFADVTLPDNTITTPAANQRWSNAVFTVKGTAKDNLAVSNVQYQLNNAGWSLATTTNKWTNWTASVNLFSRHQCGAGVHNRYNGQPVHDQ